ncbi:MAG: TonB-dependent receptor [Alcaligenaceae bacterium]|nr:TonB-dependent receptor [Alcaligenaceae bacterium]
MFKRTAICTSLFVAFLSMAHIAGADELNTINVTANSKSSVKGKKIGKTVKTAKDLSKQQVSDTKDLVRYETGVSVVEKGRMGASGYSIRGVDENRVAIMIDGLQQAETISSQGFQELFEGYGNFNNTRNGVEVETLKRAEISKGSNSVEAGSGSLGGSVIFKTKDARDFLKDKDYYAGIKYGYSSRNNQHMVSTTLAGRYKMVDALAIYTYRDGHETENFGYPTYPNVPERGTQGRARQKADPYHIKNHSLLTKFSINPNMDNRLTFVFDYNKKNAKGTDWSYTLAPLQTDVDKKETALRHTNDSSTRKNFSFVLDNFNETPLWDGLKLSVSYQTLEQRAKTDEYCDGGENCTTVSNELGLQLKDGEIVDKEGDPIRLKQVPAWEWDSTSTKQIKKPNGKKELAIVDKNGVEYPYPDTNMFGDKQDQMGVWDTSIYSREAWVNCETNGCNGDLTFYHITGNSWVGHKFELEDGRNGKVKVNLSKSESFKIKDGSDDVIFTVEEKTINGQPWRHVTSNHNDYMLIKPASQGYSSNEWKDRVLGTQTAQVKLDLTKTFDIEEVQNNLAYGLLYEYNKKYMTNYSGTSYADIKWWATGPFAELANGNRKPCYGGSGACVQEDKPETFLIPVKSNVFAVYFNDQFKVTDKVGFDIKTRLDVSSYQPAYRHGVDPALPLGLFKGMFDTTLEDLNAAGEENALRNIQMLVAQRKRFMNFSYAITGTFDPWKFLRIQLKHAKGFRAPTSDEMYFTFKHPDFSIVPNLNLSGETSFTEEASITLHKGGSYFTLGGFRTDYKNFIELAFKGYKQFIYIDKDGKFKESNGIPYRKYQNVNNAKAYVQGINIDARADLGDLTDKLKGLSLGYKLTYQTGQTLGIDSDIQGDEKNIWHAINAISPTKQVMSISYIAPDKTWGIDGYWTHVSAKKKEETYNPYHAADQGMFGAPDEGIYMKNLSKAYDVFDVVAFYEPVKYVNLKFGVYNLFNKKYATWESIRSIRQFGTSNMICKAENSVLGCKNKNQGIERFYEPGINFKFSAEVKY